MSARYLCDCGAGYSHPDQLLYCEQNNHGTAWKAEAARAREQAGRYGNEVFDAVAIRVKSLEAELATAREALVEERNRCAQIVVDCFAPSQGEDMHPFAVEALAAITKPEET